MITSEQLFGTQCNEMRRFYRLAADKLVVDVNLSTRRRYMAQM